MNADVWGPPAWIFLHSITLVYPHNPNIHDKQHYYDFFDNLKNVLPCEICKHHYKNHLQKYPLMDSLNSKVDLIKWLIKVHNEINKTKGKREWTYDEVIAHYDKLYENPAKKLEKKSYLMIGIFILLLGICIFYILKNKNRKI
tara:strand:+ start:475 stop:903 length:429 start_codon:yes stop_codon:yes gene_type:complete